MPVAAAPLVGAVLIAAGAPLNSCLSHALCGITTLLKHTAKGLYSLSSLACVAPTSDAWWTQPGKDTMRSMPIASAAVTVRLMSIVPAA